MTAIKTINNITVAKRRFSDAVSRGIDQLMKEGFNREHSTAMLLNCLKVSGPEDKEVFKVVNSYGVNLNEAVIAITVASALRQVISTRGLKPAEAINVLTERIKTSIERSSDILAAPIKESSCDMIDSGCIDDTFWENEHVQSGEIRRITKEQQPINASTTTSKPLSSKNKKTGTHSMKNNALKVAARRRTPKTEEITKPMPESSDDAKVKIELVTKSLRNHDDVNINKDSNVLTKVSRKRNRSAMSEDEHIQLQSPVKKATKRPRV